jgi:hypothetical protein
MSLEIKTGTIAMPLIEEKTGFGSFRLSGQTLRTLRKRCARCENCFTPRSQRNRNARNASSQPCRSGYRK